MINMKCNLCGHEWPADSMSSHKVDCPKGCSGNGSGVSIDVTVVVLTEKGQSGEYGVDWEYAKDSTFDGKNYDKVEFDDHGKKWNVSGKKSLNTSVVEVSK